MQTLNNPALASLIVENALDYAIFTLDLDGRITSWSPGAERILGYADAEIIGLNMSVMFLPSDLAAGADRLELQTAIEAGRAEDTRWHRRKNGERFWANGVTMRVRGAPGLLKILRDETRAKLAEDQRVLLLNELNHRIKNTLATVQSIAEQTLRAGDVERRTREALTERLIALSHAHDMLVAQNWAGADLRIIIEQALAPHEHPGYRAFEIDGPPTRLSPQQAVAMSLALHELATNAVKYGALSTPSGQVSVTWNLSYDGQGARHMTLLWQETDGPAVATPRHSGFGSRLIARSFGQESGGEAAIEYLPGGVRCTIHLPLSGPEEIPMLDVSSG
jgi:PAS domain S-box-containing protein